MLANDACKNGTEFDHPVLFGPAFRHVEKKSKIRHSLRNKISRKVSVGDQTKWCERFRPEEWSAAVALQAACVPCWSGIPICFWGTKHFGQLSFIGRIRVNSKLSLEMLSLSVRVMTLTGKLTAYFPPHSPYETQRELANMTMAKMPPEAECNEDGLHYFGLKVNHPPDVLPNSPDRPPTVHF